MSDIIITTPRATFPRGEGGVQQYQRFTTPQVLSENYSAGTRDDTISERHSRAPAWHVRRRLRPTRLREALHALQKRVDGPSASRKCVASALHIIHPGNLYHGVLSHQRIALDVSRHWKEVVEVTDDELYVTALNGAEYTFDLEAISGWRIEAEWAITTHDSANELLESLVVAMQAYSQEDGQGRSLTMLKNAYWRAERQRTADWPLQRDYLAFEPVYPSALDDGELPCAFITPGTPIGTEAGYLTVTQYDGLPWRLRLADIKRYYHQRVSVSLDEDKDYIRCRTQLDELTRQDITAR